MVMELGSPDAHSKRDKEMMSLNESSEEYSDDEADKDKKKEKTSEKPAPKIPLSEVFSDKKKDEEPRASIFESIVEKPKVEDKTDDIEAIEANETTIPQAETMTDDEARVVVEEYVEERAAAVQQELSGVVPDSPQEAEALADVIYLDALREMAEEGEPVDDERLDGAMAEVIDMIKATPSEEAEPEDDEAATTTPAATTGSSSASGTTPPTSLPPTPPIPTPTIPISAPTLTPPPGINQQFGTPPPGGNLPPNPPGGQHFNQAPPPLNPNINVAPSTVEKKKSNVSALLAGGLVGYMIGRRGGRKSAEAELMPIQKNLEKEVKDLKEKIEIREKRVRELAAERARENPDTSKALAAKLEQRVPAEVREAVQPDIEEVVVSKLPEAVPKTAPEISPSPFVMPETALPRPEAVRPEPRPEIKPVAPEKTAITMNQAELLQAAENIKLGNTNLKELYDQGRVEQADLRRAVDELLRGQNPETVANKYVKPEARLDRFEQDPSRGQLEDQATPSAVVSGTTSIPDSSLPRANDDLPGMQNGLNQTTPAPGLNQQFAPQKHSYVTQVVITAIITAVAVVAAAILFL